MVDSKVETISRLAQWRIDNFSPGSYRKSDPFKVGIWNWHLSVEKNRYLYVRLFRETSKVSKENPPIAVFVLRVSSAGAARKPYISPGEWGCLSLNPELEGCKALSLGHGPYGHGGWFMNFSFCISSSWIMFF
ncbi:hypothetical protein SLE2022_032640 [Rubroshorea leprosula]